MHELRKQLQLGLDLVPSIILALVLLFFCWQFGSLIKSNPPTKAQYSRKAVALVDLALRYSGLDFDGHAQAFLWSFAF